MKHNLELFLAGAGAVIGFFFGTDSVILGVVYYLMISMGFDIATGIFKNIGRGKGLKSSVMATGLFKKVGVLVAVSFGYFLDHTGIINVGISVEASIASFFLIRELISIVENFAEMGIKLPKFVTEKLIAMDKEQER
jgi:toxin secretion/phage lysis holin